MTMVELDLGRVRPKTVAVTLLVLLVSFGLLGAAVTRAGAQAELLTPTRWTAAALARQAQAETSRLLADAEALRDLLEQERPDPVAAMLLAQRLYARHRDGVSATAGARQALIMAAETAARYAVGEAGRALALADFQAAIGLIVTLAEAQSAHSAHLVARPNAAQPPQQVFLPRLVTPPSPGRLVAPSPP